MKLHVLLFLFLVSANICCAQDGYPVPPNNPGRLFYIQHANNHNTFVYDANLLNSKSLDNNSPINVYRINYKKGGIKEELSGLQRKMAYGVSITKAAANLFDFTLAAYPTKKFTLKLSNE